MTLKARLLIAVGLAVLALGAIGGVLVTTQGPGPAKPTVQLHIVGATSPVVTGTPTAVATPTIPTTPATTVTVRTVPTTVSPARLRTVTTPVSHARAVTTTSRPKVTLIPPIQCTPQLGCGPVKP